VSPGCAEVSSRAPNLRDQFYRLGVIMADPRIPQPARLTRAWDEITVQLQAA